ncbi:phosphosugar isomerase [Mangrovibacter sp. MFB070]|uniref:SIS domain-containing protein n=1 Tax=Mangrovibacter sp. MFB070 TaxID=1224318 RepID=UPI0004D67DD2|nr:SIS domain-containing protein [Mangrovibacter sp. MFB070]KEA52253.1 phosphosugar isomerase [Mangrovibacter sp. MFB070]
MNTTTLITDLLHSHFSATLPLKHIVLVACGGSLVDMYPAHYFLNREARELRSYMMTANEFVCAPPRTLGPQTLTIVCSHGGNTPESVAAAQLAQQNGSATICLTHNSDASLLQAATSHILYEWGDTSQVVNNPMAIILSLCVNALNHTEGYASNSAFHHGMSMIDALISRARQKITARVEDFARRFADESLFYVLSSGASYGHAYGFAICSLMEMQWLNAASIHSGEYFHGPFEVTDHSTPWIVLVNEGLTRPLDERVVRFLAHHAEKTEIVDARELGLGAIDASVVDYFNPILFYSVMCDYRASLATIRQHPLETRRYMGKIEY